MSSQVSLWKAKGINTNTEKAQWRQQREMQPQAKAAYNYQKLEEAWILSKSLLKENDVVLSSRWQFQDGRNKGMGTEWDQEVVGNVDPQKRVLCLAQGFLRGWTAFANGF